MAENRFMAKYCPGCGCEVDAQPVGASERPLNDDTQLWAGLCAECFIKAYPTR